MGEAEGGFLRGCEPRFDQQRNHTRDHHVTWEGGIGRPTGRLMSKAPQIWAMSTIVFFFESVSGGVAAREREH